MRLFTKPELMNRVSRFQTLLQSSEIEVALFSTNSDLFYFTGSIQRGIVVIPAIGEPLYFVRKNVARAEEESALAVEVWERRLLAKHCSQFAVFGFVFDVMSVSELGFYQKRVLPEGSEVKDCSSYLAIAKSVKFSSELALIKKAAFINNGIMKNVPHLWSPEMTDATLLSKIEYLAKEEFKHQELLWTRGYNMDAGMVTCVTGESSLVPTYTDFPLGGRGVSPSVAQGPSDVIMKDSFVVDFIGNVHGYNADSTRTFFVGEPPAHIVKIYEELVGTLEFIESRMVVGATGDEIWKALLEHISQYEWRTYFMGLSQKVSFVGHGIGVEVNQQPVFAPKQKLPIENSMVIAVEPKIFLPNYGVVGIENTYEMVNGKPISLMDDYKDINDFIIV